MMNHRVSILTIIPMALVLSSAWAQETGTAAGEEGMAPETMAKQPPQGMQHDKPSPDEGTSARLRRMQGGSPPPDARDPDAYSDGYDFGDIPRLRLADETSFFSVLMDRLEQVESHDNASSFYDLQAWYGRDYNRAVLKAEGTIDNGRLEEASTEILWGHAVASYWDTQLGMRYDSGDGPNRKWLAFGAQGLAPYWFEVDATGYVGENGRTALNLELSYDLLLTQKLILQPRFETDWYGKRDAGRGLGKGISEIKTGVRLRYEIRREFAPYIGLEWAGKFGGTSDFARLSGQATSEARFIAGLRFWF